MLAADVPVKTCRVFDCAREKLHGNGLCGTHESRRANGRPEGGPLAARPPCDLADCSRQQFAHGWCNPHYQRWKRYGDPTGGGKPRRAKGAGNLSPDGYVIVTRGGRKKPEHVWIMEQHLGRELLPAETVHHLNGVRHDNRLSNLELWSSAQPAGQRVIDKVMWARELLATYEPELALLIP